MGETDEEVGRMEWIPTRTLLPLHFWVLIAVRTDDHRDLL